MIKLIATDVDGTLVKDSSPEVYPELLDVIKELRKKDIIVCIASGRQCPSIEWMFKDIAHDLIFIAENGAHIKCRGTNMHVVPMNREYFEGIVREARETGELEVMANAPDVCLLESKNEKFVELIRDGYKNKYRLVEDILKEPDEIVKVSIWKQPSVRDFGEKKFIPEWKDKVTAVMAGEDWVDFMDSSVNKGSALKTIQDFFHIKPEETMVFGDNGNDIGMFKAAGESYAVENAKDFVKENARHICGSWKEKGVLKVLKELL